MGKQQSVTITVSSDLSEEELWKMQKSSKLKREKKESIEIESEIKG